MPLPKMKKLTRVEQRIAKNWAEEYFKYLVNEKYFTQLTITTACIPRGATLQNVLESLQRVVGVRYKKIRKGFLYYLHHYLTEQSKNFPMSPSILLELEMEMARDQSG